MRGFFKCFIGGSMDKKRVRGNTSRRNRASFGATDIISGGGFPVAAIVNFLAVILLAIHRIFLAGKIYDDANGYVGMAVFVILCVGAVSIIPFKNAQKRLIRSRIQKEQIKNIGQVLKVGMILSGVVNLVLSALVFFLSSKLSMVFFGNIYGSLSFRYLALFLLVSSVAGSLMGFYDGNFKKDRVVVTRILYVLFLFVFVMIFLEKMSDYGIKASNFLKNAVFRDSYGAAGISFGVVLAAFLDVIALFGGFLLIRNTLRANIRNDKTKTEESVAGASGLLFTSALPDFLKNILFVLPLFLSVLFFCMVSKESGNVSLVSDLGIFFGKFASIFMVPFILSILASLKISECIWDAYQEKNMSKVRSICSGEMKLQAGFMGFFAGTFITLAGPICNLFFHFGDSEKTSLLLFISGFLLIVYTLGLTAFRLLVGLRRDTQAYISLGVAAIVHLIVALICEFGLKLGLSGILYSAIAFALVLLFLSLYFLKRFVRYQQEWMRSLVIPNAFALVLGLLARGLYMILDNPLGSDFSAILVLVLMLLAYVILFFKLFRMKKRELQFLPGSRLISMIMDSSRMHN